MSTLLRWFSPAYRYALAAEAEGRYIDAARAYALCGQRLKVAEMHLLEAERRGAPASALRELHVAAHFVGERSASSQALRLRLGQLYLRILKKSVLTPADHELCSEAADLLLGAGDAAGAGAAYELCGNLERAAAAYEQAGEIERVEELLGAAEARRKASTEERQTLATYRMQLALGQRAEALFALRRHAAVAADSAAAQRLLFDLQKRLPACGQVRLVGLLAEILYVGRFPLRIGRAATGAAHSLAGDTEQLLALPDLGLSREHAQIDCNERDGATTFLLRDLGSKNGTTLSGLAVAGSLPLRGEGEIGLGPHVALRFAVVADRLELEVLRGLGRGLRAVASPRPIALAEGLTLHFGADDGQPRLSLSETAAGELLLNGQRVPRQIQLLRGDRVEAAGRRYEVL